MLEWGPAGTIRRGHSGNGGQLPAAADYDADTANTANTEHPALANSRGLHGSRADVRLRLHALPWNALASRPLLDSKLCRCHGSGESGQRVERAGDRDPARRLDVWLPERGPDGQSRAHPDMGAQRRPADSMNRHVMDTSMKMQRITPIAFVLGALVVSIPWITASVSTPAPNVSVHTADGMVVRLADYKGKVVLIDFWASWCPPCKASFPALDAVYREYREKGLEVLAVNVDERRRDADTFLDARPHRLTVLYDPKGVSPEAFGVKGMPSSFLIDRAGNIRFTHLGYSGNVADSYRQEITQLLSEH